MKFLGQGFQKLENKETNGQTHRQMQLNALPAAFAGGKIVHMQ